MFRDPGKLAEEANEDFMALLEKHLEPSVFPSHDYWPINPEEEIIKKAKSSSTYAMHYIEETRGSEEVTAEQWIEYGKEKTSFKDPVINEVKAIVMAPYLKLKQSIIDLLIEKAVKMPASDIDAHLRHQDVDEIKELCEEMYHNGKISRTGNYRYFILTEGQEKPKKTSAPKTEEVDIEKELEKLKGLLDKGLIAQEQYDAKSNELLGL
jgi:hypothetical protein